MRKSLPLAREVIRACIARHYGRVSITDGQMNDELVNLARHKRNETLDDFSARLYFTLEQKGYDWDRKLKVV